MSAIPGLSANVSTSATSGTGPQSSGNYYITNRGGGLFDSFSRIAERQPLVAAAAILAVGGVLLLVFSNAGRRRRPRRRRR